MIALGIDPRELQAVIFDFDGVILESAAIKEKAFLELFAEYPEHLEAIRAHHRQHLGVSRFEKFEWIYENLVGVSLTRTGSAELGERFSRLVLDKTLSCPLVPGAVDLLRLLGPTAPLFIASATPHTELEQIVESRDLGGYFRAVHGSPPGKAELVQRILDDNELDASAVLVIGDGMTDYDAARRAGCRFVARDDPGAPPQPWPPHVTRVPTLEPLRDLLA